MTFSRTLGALLLAAGIALSGSARAAADPAHYLLTPVVMGKLQAMEKESSKNDDAGEKDEEALTPKDADDLIRKLDKAPKAKAMLARYGLTTREYALTTFAMLHAGFYVAMEGAMDKKKAAEALAGYTKEQRANIEFMRKMQAKK